MSDVGTRERDDAEHACERCTELPSGGRTRTARSGMQSIPPGHHTTVHAAELAGLSYRQVDYMVRSGRVEPARAARYSGGYAAWSDADVAALTRVARRMEFGLSLDAALRPTDPVLPEPIGADDLWTRANATAEAVRS